MGEIIHKDFDLVEARRAILDACPDWAGHVVEVDDETRQKIDDLRADLARRADKANRMGMKVNVVGINKQYSRLVRDLPLRPEMENPYEMASWLTDAMTVKSYRIMDPKVGLTGALELIDKTNRAIVKTKPFALNNAEDPDRIAKYGALTIDDLHARIYSSPSRALAPYAYNELKNGANLRQAFNDDGGSGAFFDAISDLEDHELLNEKDLTPEGLIAVRERIGWLAVMGTINFEEASMTQGQTEAHAVIPLRIEQKAGVAINLYHLAMQGSSSYRQIPHGYTLEYTTNDGKETQATLEDIGNDILPVMDRYINPESDTSEEQDADDRRRIMAVRRHIVETILNDPNIEAHPIDARRHGFIGLMQSSS